jgi:putative addiction module killer protein
MLSGILVSKVRSGADQGVTENLKTAKTTHRGQVSDRPRPRTPQLQVGAGAPLTICSREATVTPVIEVRKTEVFVQWLDGVRDIQVRARIQARIERLASGNPGDVEPVGEGVSELRINYGPGYRVYFKKQGRELIILLAGGNKNTQVKDINTALRLSRYLSE